MLLTNGSFKSFVKKDEPKEAVSEIDKKREDMIIYLLITYPDKSFNRIKNTIRMEDIQSETNRKIIKKLYEELEKGDINNILDKSDDIERIYINFCNPWPKGKHRKKRLTHTRQLEKYKEFLGNGAQVFFKTDDDGLFNDSIKYFEDSGFRIEKRTYDLENEIDFWENIETEHEKMFKEQGIKIKALIASI